MRALIVLAALLVGCKPAATTPVAEPATDPSATLIASTHSVRLLRIDDKERGVTCYMAVSGFTGNATGPGVDCMATRP